jgi:hypothetical protein
MKVIAVVVLVLAACEVGVRVFEKRLSVDVNAPAISKRLVEGEGQHVLVFGNSLVRDGVNPILLEEELKAQGAGPLHVERAFLMNTVVNDWYYAFKHHFVDVGRLPDTLILCFANHHLQDYTIQRPLVARYYSGARDLPQIFRDDVQDFDGRIEFLLSAWSASYAHRTNVQRRVLDGVIPRYRESAVRINEYLNEAERQQGGSHQPTYRRLERLVEMAQSHGVRVMLVAMPVKSSYNIAPEIKSFAETAGITFIDSRSVEGLNAENFNDEMHMNTQAANIYSRFLARQLAGYLKQSSPAQANGE